MDCSPPGSSVHGISQARILEWVAISFSRGSSRIRDQTDVSCIDKWILYHWATGEAWWKQNPPGKSLEYLLDRSGQYQANRDFLHPLPTPRSENAVSGVEGWIREEYCSLKRDFWWEIREAGHMLFLSYFCCLVAKSCPALLWPHGL